MKRVIFLVALLELLLGSPPNSISATPSAPRDLEVKVAGNSVTQRWKAPAGGGDPEYLIESCTVARCIAFVDVKRTTETTVIEERLSPGTGYTYRIKAKNADGVSEPSESKTVTTETEHQIGEPTRQTFAGLHFGVGVSYTQTLGRDRIRSASVDPNGIVRIDGEANAIPRVMLESHYFFTPRTQAGQDPTDFCFLFIPAFCMKTRGWGAGPFVALQPGTDQVIQSIAAGLMWGFKYNTEAGDARSWNFGIGATVEPNSKTLADGFSDGQHLPSGQTQVLYKDRTLVGVMALLSFGFF